MDLLDDDQVAVTLGVEPELVTTFAYARRIAGAPDRLAVGLGGAAKIAPTRLFAGAWRLGLLAPVERRWERVALAVEPQAYVAHTANAAGAITGLGLEVRGGPAWTPGKGRLGLDLGWQGTLAAHVHHADPVRDTFEDRYPDGARGTPGPVDGWYGATASRLRIGLAGGGTVGHLRIGGALGALFVAPQAQGALFSFDLGQVPFAAEVALGWGW